MATPSSINPDMPITLKINYDGVTRKFKLPLRDLGASTLEDKVGSPLKHIDAPLSPNGCCNSSSGLI
jgi:next to BRCA1 gene 1 protein